MPTPVKPPKDSPTAPAATEGARSSASSWPAGGSFPSTGMLFTPDRNQDGNDYGGAFLPESQLFARLYKLPAAHRFSLAEDKKLRRRFVVAALAAAEPASLDVVAFFQHGLKASLPQLDFNRGNVGVLADALARVLKRDAPVVLYCCSTAGGIDNPQTALNEGLIGEGGFADALRDALVARGWRGHVDAHERAAHTTKNSLCRRFRGSEPNVLGGEWIIAPDDPLYRRWRDLLDEDARKLEPSSQLRFRFPFMTVQEIRAHVG